MKVTYVDHMGNDLSVVNAARVSFNKKSELEYDTVEERAGDGEWVSIKRNYRLSEKDTKLIKYLASHGHWTPFGHTAITLHIKAPIFVARQLGKHQVGFVWNEVSRRYVTDEPEFYDPDVWRKAAANVKQGSSDEGVSAKDLYGCHGLYTESIADHLEDALVLYSNMLGKGVCPEQARMVLPQSMYTEWYWTGNLYGFANVLKLRTDSHTQKETRDIAHQIGEIIKPLYPVSWEALTQ